jgi:serine/threonine-protein kinase
MPYVEGPSLRGRLAAHGQLPVDEAVQITGEVADALAYAHSHGIVHRDIKPDNILFEAGQAVVTDFGIAKALEVAADSTLTSGQIAVGTVAYMSPEQAGAADTLDARSDLYSLALVLYEMLAGELPFHALTPNGILARKSHGQYTPIRPLRGTVPQHIDSAIARALQPVAADRFASVAEFASALRRVDTEPARQRDRLSRPTLLSALLVIAIAAAAAIWFKRDSASPIPSGLGRVVVAPFENRTGMISLDAVGLMAGDWITEGLQRTGVVQVVPTATALQASRYLAASKVESRSREPLHALALETGAGTVVGGAFYRQGDLILFRVEVADQNGSRLVGGLTDVVAPLSDPVRGVEELRNRLMGWLAVRYDERLKGLDSRTDRPPTFEAYRAFSEAMSRYIAVNNAQALPLFLHAFKVDSSFTVALLYASICLTNLGQWSHADSLLQTVNERRESLSEYDRAWLDYRLAFVHGDHEAALAAIRSAANQAPGSKAAYNHAVEAFLSGHVREALATVQALPADRGPMRGFSPYWDIYGAILHALGQYSKELETGVAARQLYPDRLTRITPIARALAAAGQLDSLRREVRKAEQLPTDPVGWDYGHLLGEVAEELRAHGHPNEAEKYFEQLRGWLAANDRGPTTRWRLVRTLYSLGRRSEARQHLVALRRSDPANVEYLGMEGLLYARDGDRNRAQTVLDSLTKSRLPYDFGAGRLYAARIAAVLGYRDLAITRLRDAFLQGRSYDLALHRDVDFESLNGYPPFEQLKRGKD